MKYIIAATFFLVALALSSPLRSGEFKTRVVPRLTRVILNDGRELTGTVLISGPRGIVLVVDDVEEFIQKASVKETLPAEAEKKTDVEPEGETEPSEGTVSTTEKASMLQTYQVSRVCGQYIVGAKTSGGGGATADDSNLMPDLENAGALPLPKSRDKGKDGGKADIKKFGILKPQKKQGNSTQKKQEQDFGIIPERSDKKQGAGVNTKGNGTGLEGMELPSILQDMIKGKNGMEGFKGIEDILDAHQDLVR